MHCLFRKWAPLREQVELDDHETRSSTMAKFYKDDEWFADKSRVEFEGLMHMATGRVTC